MSIRSVALLIGISLFIPQAGAQPQEQEKTDKKSESYAKDVASFATGLLEIYSGLMAKGNEIWDGLGTMQAKKVLDDVASAAGNQAKDNEILLSAMQKSIKDKETENLMVSFRVAMLHNSLKHLGDRLDTFSVEVDRAAHPIGEQARVKFAIAYGGKEAELDAIVKSWKAGRFDEAIEHLKKAQEYMDVMIKIISCLQESVKSKKPACDPKQFSMPDDQIKRVAETMTVVIPT